jgi:hypothetical protein
MKMPTICTTRLVSDHSYRSNKSGQIFDGQTNGQKGDREVTDLYTVQITRNMQIHASKE